MKWKFWAALVLAGAGSMAQAVPLDTIGTFCNLYPAACRSGTEALLSARGTGTNAYYVLEVDPTTGALPVSITGTPIVISGTVNVSNLPTTVDTNTGAAGASTLRVVDAGRVMTNVILANNPYASTNVTTAAYVQLISSTANVINVQCVSNISGSIITLATGAALSEVDRFYVPPGGSGCFTFNIAASTRISLKALDTTASVGYFLFTGY